MINVTNAAVDAEAAILGSMLIDSTCIGDVLLAVSAGDFLTPRHGAIFTAIRELFTAGRPVDPVTVVNRVGTECRETISECMTITPTAANVLTYCDALREQTRLYRLKLAAENTLEAADLETAQKLLTQALADAGDRPGVKITSLAEMMGHFFQRMSAPEPPYLHWGFSMLDKSLAVAGGKYVLIGARPSTGKTALALQLGLNIAESKRVGFFSLETGENTAGDRIVAQNMDSTLPHIQRRQLDGADVLVLSKQAARLTERAKDFDFVTGSALTVADIRAIALARRYDVVIVDYVQLIAPGNPKLAAERTLAMQSVSMELRAMAQLTGITVIALAQLRRPDPGAKPKTPTMADLKESGQFEQDADVVLLLYLEDAENRFSDRFLKLDKNKEGEAGLRCRLKFDGRKQRFTYIDPRGDAAEVAFEELPEQTEIPFEEER